jgi:hypothetical protein
MNIYGYTRSRPLSSNDPFGLSEPGGNFLLDPIFEPIADLVVTGRGGEDAADSVASVTPVVGDAKDVIEVVSGVNAVTNEPLTPGERIATAVGAALPLIPAKSCRAVLKKCGGDNAVPPRSRPYDCPEIETLSPTPVKDKDVTNAWDDFLGPDQTGIDPRDGLPDHDRIWSADGKRTIRYGDHEMGSKSNKHRYHSET